ncbi:unnamed protein product [Dicrocoelium dendriticum]|nr:unnamed protein product [Dicrocoelium dendriticum]CAH8557985.1 unnamed protein product [Dicrocoelium dendriticum]
MQETASDVDGERYGHANSIDKPLKMTKRANLIKELVDSELRFSTDMKRLNEAIRSVSIPLSTDDRAALFGNLPQIVKISQELHACWNKEILKCTPNRIDQALIATITYPFRERIRDVFHVYASKYDVYTTQKNPTLISFAQQVVEKLRFHNPLLADLNTELIKPVQRIVKYKQLFEQLKDHTEESHADYNVTFLIYETFCELLRAANEDKRWNEILSEVFEESSRERRLRSRSKSIRHLLDVLHISERIPSDPKLSHEKWKLDSLYTATSKVRDWLEKRFYQMQEAFVKERDFLKCVLDLCDPTGHISIHSGIVCSSSSDNALPMEEMKLQLSVMDRTLNYLSQVTEVKLKKNVLRRLDELLELMNDPELLINEFEKTEKELNAATAQLRQAESKNQATINLVERRDELEHTKKTLRVNLLQQLPLLVRFSEKCLLAAMSYAFRLWSDVMDRCAEWMKGNLAQLPSSSLATRQMSTDDFTSFVDRIAQEMKSHIPRRSTSNLIAPIIKLNTSPSLQTSRLKEMEMEICKTAPFYKVPTPTTTVPSMEVTRCRGITRTSSDSAKSSSFDAGRRSIGFVELEVPGTSKARPRSMAMGASADLNATHKAIYAYTARDENEVSMEVGQLVTLLQDRDNSGNTQWFKVSVLPQKKVGYVPANRLVSIR